MLSAFGTEATWDAGDAGREWIERALMSGVSTIADPAYREAAACLLLDRDHWANLTARRGRASISLGVSPDTFRHRYEAEVLAETALHVQQALDEAATTPSSVGQVDAPGAEGEPPQVAADPSLGFLMNGVSDAAALVGDLLVVRIGSRVAAKTLAPDHLLMLRSQRTSVLADPALALEFLLQPDGDQCRESEEQ
jgi:hypothetical protein